MSNSIPGNHKHMTQDDRISIEKGLDDGLSMRKIAEPLGKDPSTISKEIKMYITVKMYPCSGGTDTAVPEERYRQSGTGYWGLSVT